MEVESWNPEGARMTQRISGRRPRGACDQGRQAGRQLQAAGQALVTTLYSRLVPSRCPRAHLALARIFIKRTSLAAWLTLSIWRRREQGLGKTENKFRSRLFSGTSLRGPPLHSQFFIPAPPNFQPTKISPSQLSL